MLSLMGVLELFVEESSKRSALRSLLECLLVETLSIDLLIYQLYFLQFFVLPSLFFFFPFQQQILTLFHHLFYIPPNPFFLPLNPKPQLHPHPLRPLQSQLSTTINLDRLVFFTMNPFNTKTLLLSYSRINPESLSLHYPQLRRLCQYLYKIRDCLPETYPVLTEMELDRIQPVSAQG